METMEKPELLFVDEKGLKNEKLNLIRAESELNKFLEAAEKILGSLDNDRKWRLKKEKLKFVDSEVKKLFNFPNASDEFNMQALGIDLTEVRSFANIHDNRHNYHGWSGYQFYIGENGRFVAREEQPILENYKIYADTDKKKRALELATAFEKLFEDAQKEGLTEFALLPDAGACLKNLLKVEGEPRRPNSRLVVNKAAVAHVR